MQDFEKAEIATLPEKYRPMGAWSYFGYGILYAIPLVGLICLIIHALDDGHIVRRSYARSFFCSAILGLIVFGILALILITTGVVGTITESINTALF